MYLSFVYISAFSSDVIRIQELDFLENIELDILKYKELGKIYISGDFDSRTANISDCFECDKYLYENIYFVEGDVIPARANRDSCNRLQGRHILELGIFTGVIIANNRSLLDREIGQFTYFSQTGESNVDYLLLSAEDLYTLSDFEILPFNEFSDLAPLSFSLLRKVKEKNFNFKGNDTHRESQNIFWDVNKTGYFVDKVGQYRDTFSQLPSSLNTHSINNVVDSFSTLLINISVAVFGKTITNCSRNHINGPKWFDKNCAREKKKK